jgi:hypothetical protein
LNTEGILTRIGGVAMLGVFGINVYLGLYDTNLQFAVNHLHYEINWVLAAADLLAALFLLAKPRNLILKGLGGIIWPLLYIGSLILDVETRMCLGASSAACFPSVSAAYHYLILGSQAEEWAVWPYTIRLGIALAVITLVLSLISMYFRKPKMKETKTTPPPQNMPPPGGDPNVPPVN